MQGQQAVLCLQDGSDLNFAEHPGCIGLGLIGKNKRSAGTLGLHMHSTLVVNGEGIPLGVPHIQYEAPDGQADKGRPLEERKTYRWVRGLQACAALAAELDGVRPVSVMDREGDVFALFAEQRVAPVGLRWKTVELPAPAGGAAPVSLNLVHVREETEPDNAERVLHWYRLRWRIEDWHRVLKSGCKVEHLGHRTGERIERAVTINAVIAWRLTVMTLLGRETPELPSAVLYSDIEIMALNDFARDRKLPPPDNLGRAVRTMAILGGYLNRNKEPPPGHQKIWSGYTLLNAASQAYERLIRMKQDSDCTSKWFYPDLCVNGRVRVSVRRVWVSLSSVFPRQELFAHSLSRLRAEAPG